MNPADFSWLIPAFFLVIYLVAPSGLRRTIENWRDARWRKWLNKKDGPLPEETDWSAYEDFVGDELHLEGDTSIEAFEKEQEDSRLLQQAPQGLPAPAHAPAAPAGWPQGETYTVDQHREPVAYYDCGHRRRVATKLMAGTFDLEKCLDCGSWFKDGKLYARGESATWR